MVLGYVAKHLDDVGIVGHPSSSLQILLTEVSMYHENNKNTMIRIRALQPLMHMLMLRLNSLVWFCLISCWVVLDPRYIMMESIINVV